MVVVGERAPSQSQEHRRGRNSACHPSQGIGAFVKGIIGNLVGENERVGERRRRLTSN